ncbi:putative toxin-antitoxin system toxin component, PIN family [uncultured Fibrella sp.]|uniref:putative toxin-antitoxin system toxin component, PIN family n=1 Tax=uncultured Fibrella sp. TaxID=1284596 RepID=UPI0035CA2D7A
MRIVVDTNVLLAALPKASRFRAIINALVSGRLNLVVSTPILLEYQEILTQKTNASIATNFLEFLVTMPGVVHVDPSFTWEIIKDDLDDNKFVDAGLIAGADYIVTYDGHFDVVKHHPFPKIAVVNPDVFVTLLLL